MKKIGVVFVALFTALAIVGCASGPSASDGMSSAKNSAPVGSLIGQASNTTSAAKAVTDAKFQLVRAMSLIVKDMVDAYVTSGKLNTSTAETFRQGVNTALTRSSLSGAVKQDAGEGKGKVYWAVYYMNKADVLKEINLAVAASKQLNPAAAAFNTDGFDAAYSNAANREWKN